jgi:hypothetical protein
MTSVTTKTEQRSIVETEAHRPIETRMTVGSSDRHIQTDDGFDESLGEAFFAD